MIARLEIGDVAVDVVRKEIKNVHLSVHPPTGRVRISAPARMSLDTIRVFAITKLGWIKQHQRKVRDQERESPRDYVERESHSVWGRRYLLNVIEREQPAMVEVAQSRSRFACGREHRRCVERPSWKGGTARSFAGPCLRSLPSGNR